jgi:hypothetical protein
MHCHRNCVIAAAEQIWPAKAMAAKSFHEPSDIKNVCIDRMSLVYRPLLLWPTR